jgi:hypothetical protein
MSILVTHIEPRGQAYAKKNRGGEKDDRNYFKKKNSQYD